MIWLSTLTPTELADLIKLLSYVVVSGIVLFFMYWRH